MVPHRLGERRLNRARETLLIDGTVGYQGRTARFWLRQLAGKLTDYPVISTDDLPQRAFSGGENTVCEGQPSRRLMQVSIPNEPTRNLLVDLSQNLFVGNYIVFCEAHQTAVTEHVQVGLRRLEGDGLANILEAAVRPLEQRAPPRHLARGIESVEEELTYGNPSMWRPEGRRAARAHAPSVCACKTAHRPPARSPRLREYETLATFLPPPRSPRSATCRSCCFS